MWNQNILDELSKRKEETHLGGGEKKIQRQHQKGKMTARERIKYMLDPGTFHEFDEMVMSRSIDFGMDEKKKYGDGVVTGYGLIDGRLVFIASQDFTVCGGAGGEVYALKICRTLEKALDMKAPIIFINDSGGARIEEGICALSSYSKLFYLNTVASGVIPQIALILGPCAGGASYSPALCDFVFMVHGESEMYLTGPKVVEVAIGEHISSDELGGVNVHTKTSGVAHFAFPSEYACIDGVKKLLEYLPQNYMEFTTIKENRYTPRKKKLIDLVPDNSRQMYDVLDVIYNIFDDLSVMEVQPSFAKNISVGFARLEGISIGFVANQANYMGGTIDCDSADKAARFIRFCDCFNIPMISFVDIPGFCPGSKQEHAGIIRHGAKLLYAFAEATVPKICVVLRKAYGGAYCAMNSKELGADIVYAWPIAEIAVMGAEGAIKIVKRRELKNNSGSEEAKQKYISEYEAQFMNPYFAATHGLVDEIIRPDETRERLIFAVKMLKNKGKNLQKKKHGNIPL